MSEGKILRLTLLTPALVHWSFDAWRTSRDTSTRDTGLGAYIVDLPTKELPAGARVCFTFHWREENKWEGTDFQVMVEPAGLRAQEVLAVDLMSAQLGSANDQPLETPNSNR